MGITFASLALRQYTEQQPEILLEGKTVGEVLESFKVRLSDAGNRFFPPDCALYEPYLNDKDIRL
jgi:hypothetical protein